MAEQLPGVVLANAGRWNWDAALNLSALEEVGAHAPTNDYFRHICRPALHWNFVPLWLRWSAGGLTVSVWRSLDQVTTLTSCSADHPSDDEILALVNDSTAVLITKEIPVSAELIGRLPESVRLLVEAGTGYNNIDMAAAKAKGLTVCNVPAYSQEAVAHLVITFVLNHSCSLVEQQKLISAGDRSNGFSAPLRTQHFELGGQTIGLIGGTGNIGSRVASVAQALGMRVLVSSRTPPAETDQGSAIEIISSVDDLLRRSDFVSIHCPLNDATRHLLSAEKLKLMKPTALLINTARGAPCPSASTSHAILNSTCVCADLIFRSRLCVCAHVHACVWCAGAIIDEGALIEALAAGTIAGAALDVQDPEPAQEQLLAAPNCIVTPHIGWKRLETRQRLADGLTSNVVSFLGGAPVNVVSS